MGDNVKYIVRLSASERGALEGVVNKGKAAAAKRTRAHILLKADANVEGAGWGIVKLLTGFLLRERLSPVRNPHEPRTYPER